MIRNLANGNTARTRHARVRALAPATRQRLDFAGVDGPVWIEGAKALPVVLARIIQDWPHRVTSVPATRPCPPDQQALAQIVAGPEGLTAHSLFTDSPLPGLTLTSAACALVADLSQSYIDSSPGRLALHCGAVEIGGRLVVLTGAHRAGKSTLVSRLTAEPDMRVFCDDVLPIHPDGRGVALGIAPRLRLPLPASASPAFRSHVARWSTVQDERYAYLCPPGRAAHGATAPLGAIITLDRRDSGSARLHHMAPDTALRQLLSHNLADLGTAKSALDKMLAVIEGVTCLRLIYSELEEAVTLLRRAFCGSLPLNPALDIGPDCTEHAPPQKAPTAVDLHQTWRQNPKVALRRVAESHFLWMPDDTTLWQLNLLGGAIWALLEIPGSATDLAEALAEVFPDQPKDSIVSDTAILLSQLAEKEMILPA
ncbi:MAG: PqqD family protein [Pseudotabrizicola sp.]|uniref:PqqD family protein n=1 Tax=Pseudotabrizicola sp. TaxID=2939647 RepID=UPI002730E694|nr:PqqD family protein [Pseudotabrizicola sp.]MDP2083434.1 PqqD family protein [Pseudotabrizicola sp.]MDZ7572819.1 PqqD family protein [Pseudotabrizicola sp.]